MSSSRPAFVYGLLAAGLVSFSMSPILIRLAGDVPGLSIAVWRSGFAVLLLAPSAVRRIGPEVRHFSWCDAGLILGAGVLLGLHFVAWIESLFYTSVASASVLVTTTPIFLAVLGYVFLNERLAGRVVAAIVVAVGGAVLLNWGDAGATTARPEALWGNSLALGASLMASLYLLIGRVVRQRASWLAYVFPLYTVAAMTVCAIAWVRKTPLLGFGADFYGLCLLMGLGPSILGHGSFNYALRYFPAAILGLLNLTEPVGATVIAYFLFDEVPRGWALVGMLIVLAAVSFAILHREQSTGPKAKEKASE